MDSSINDAVYARVGQAWGLITELLPLLAEEQPLPTRCRDGMISTITPFSKEAFQATMKSADSTYSCGINMAWLSMMFTPCPGVPINMRHIDNLRKLIDESGRFPDTLTIALEPGTKELDPVGLKAVSPEEIRHAFIIHIGEDLNRAPTTENIKKWHQALLSVPCKFKFAAPTDFVLENRRSREHYQILSENMRRTAFASIFEIYAYKVVLEESRGSNVAHAKIAEAYAQVKMSESSETVTKTFVETALMVHGQIMKNPAIKSVLMALDGHQENPINSVHKIRELMVKADKDEHQTSFCSSC